MLQGVIKMLITTDRVPDGVLVPLCPVHRRIDRRMGIYLWSLGSWIANIVHTVVFIPASAYRARGRDESLDPASRVEDTEGGL